MSHSRIPPEDAFDQWLDELAEGTPSPATDERSETAAELHQLLGIAPVTGPRLGKARRSAIRHRILPSRATTPLPLRSGGATGIVAGSGGVMPLDRHWGRSQIVNLVSAAILTLLALASVGLVMRFNDATNMSSMSATASMMSFAAAPALASQTPETPSPTPPHNYRPELVESVPVPGTDPNEVFVVLRDPEDTYGPPPAGCSPEEVATIMVRFFAAWSAGDVASMERYLAPSPDPLGTPIPESERTALGYLAWFGINPIPGGIADGSGAGGYSAPDVLEAAAARHEQNEVIQVLQIEYGSTWYDTGIGMTFDLARIADDAPGHIIGGKGGIDCQSGRITAVSASDQSPVVPEVWFDGVAPIVVPDED